MQSTNIKTIVREISNAVGALEDSGIDCKLSVIWLDIDSVRVVVSVECEDFMLIDASLTGTPDRPELLVDLRDYLVRLAASVGAVNTV
ncbi:MAG TPA: hypothetical protein PK244_09810 [Pseudomonadales bacterium]|nr:hypothetical protein [Pseudomonadales bacterium]